METNKPRNDEKAHFDPRWQVREFAEAMEGVLQENDDKGGWWNCPIEYLRRRLKEELEEYFSSGDAKELLDTANFCMMLWDRDNTLKAIKEDK